MESAKQLFNNPHDHYSKESNYVSPRAIHESVRHENYQRIDNNSARGPDHVTTSYVKLQKEKYEIKQENIYASQRELHKNDSGHQQQHGHQKLTASNSLPLAQNASYSLPKSSSNNNLIRYNEYDQAAHDRANAKYETEGSVPATGRNAKAEFEGRSVSDRNSKYEYDTKNGSTERNPKNEYEGKSQTDRNSKYEICEERNDERMQVRYEQSNRAHEKRSSAYEIVDNCYDQKYDLQSQLVGDKKIDDINDAVRYEVPHDFKVGEKVTCLKTSMTERAVPHKVSIEYRGKDFASSLPPEMRIPDGNCTDISTLPSEDELSNGSGNVSPRLRRANKHRGGNLGSSNGSSRNHSPRPKPGVRNSHRNSANLTSSTLQEDLMKLINPDFIADDSQTASNNLSSDNGQNSNRVNNNNNNNNMLEIQNRCRSRENLCGNSASTLSVLPANGQENGNSGSEVILTMARPATVISNASTASSPAPSENKMSKEER